jgi:hypothetical protein
MRILTEDDLDPDWDQEDTIWCPICLQRGYQNPLGHKILMPNEPRPADYFDWYECFTCGVVRHYVEIPKERQ